MPAPTFLCVGSQKCGTSWLSHCVAQHPEVCTANTKEVHFFDHKDKYSLGFKWYESQFECPPTARAIGEFTPNYFWTAGHPPPSKRNHLLGSAERIADRYGPGVGHDLRIIISLRDPVDRAISGYYHDVSQGRFSPRRGIMDHAADWPHVIELGRYDVNMARWLEVFPSEAILTLIYEEDIKPDENKLNTIKRVYDHIGVGSNFVPYGIVKKVNARRSHFNMRTQHVHKMVGAVMRRLPDPIKRLSLWDVSISVEDRVALAAEYASGVADLEEMLGRELPWSQVKAS